MSATPEERVLLYNWESQKAEELSDSSTFELIGFTDKLFHLCPIRKGWAVIGIEEKDRSAAFMGTFRYVQHFPGWQKAGRTAGWKDRNKKTGTDSP